MRPAERIWTGGLRMHREEVILRGCIMPNLVGMHPHGALSVFCALKDTEEQFGLLS